MKGPGRIVTRRVFIGIKVPAAMAGLLAGFGRAPLLHAAGVRWSDENDLHITVKFLGAVQAAVLEQVRSSLEEIRIHPFKIGIAGAGRFESAGILYVGVQKTAELVCLQESVERAMAAYGFAREQRPYSPHITVARRIGRLRGGLPRDLVARLDTFCKHMPVQFFSVQRMILYESISAHYQSLQEYDLWPTHSLTDDW